MTRVRQRLVPLRALASLLVVMAAAAPAAPAAGDASKPSAGELWQAYPLHPDATSAPSRPPATTTQRTRGSEAAARGAAGTGGGGGVPVVATLGVLCALAAAGVLVLRAGAGRRRRPAPATSGAAVAVAGPPPAAAHVSLFARDPEVSGMSSPMTAHRERSSRRPATPRARPPHAHRPWTAEIEWQSARDRARFCAVARSAGEDSAEERAQVARSSWFAWPPGDPEAVRAMNDAARAVEEDLLAAAWTPLEPGDAWYAKRFAWAPAGAAEPAERPRPAAAESRAEQAHSKRPLAAEPHAERPARAQSHAEQTRIERPPAAESRTERPAAANVPAQRPAAGKSRAERAAAPEPRAGRATSRPTGAGRQSAEGSSAAKPRVKRPAATHPAARVAEPREAERGEPVAPAWPTPAAPTPPNSPPAPAPQPTAAAPPPTEAPPPAPQPAAPQPAAPPPATPPHSAPRRRTPPPATPPGAPSPAPRWPAALPRLETWPTALPRVEARPGGPPGAAPPPAREKPTAWPDDAAELVRCELTWDAGYVSSRFVAMAHEPGRRRGRAIGRSRPFRWGFMGDPDPREQDQREAVSGLESALLAAGWQRVGRGGAWYAERFVWRGAEPAPEQLEPVVAEQPDADADLWRCEIAWGAGYVNSQFVALARAPGRRRARPIGRSQTFRWMFMNEPNPAGEEFRDAVRRLESALLAAGWERAGQGREWYAERFVWRPDGAPPDRLRPATDEARRAG